MARDWTALNEHGKRQYKFVQKDSIAEVQKQFPNQFDQGVCMGVSMNWIKEKLSTSHGLLKPNGPPRSSVSREFAATRNPMKRLKDASPSTGRSEKMFPYLSKGKSGRRNQEAMVNGARSQRTYLSGTSANGGNVRVLSTHLGLVESGLHVEPKNVRGKNNDPERLHAESIARAAGELGKGEALLIELEQKREGNERPSGHAVAFYKSSGDTLYFFDPNAGVYEIPRSGEPPRSRKLTKQPPEGSAAAAEAARLAETQPTNAEAFMKSWMDVYQNGDAIEWQTPERDWYHGYHAVRSPSHRPTSEPAAPAEESTA